MSSLPNLHLSQTIKQKAFALGFTLCGITSPEPPPHLAHYAQWIDNGYHAEMGYMASERNRERRADIQKILPGCKSVIVLATNYYQGDVAPQSHAPTGKVGRYAWNDDYHDVIKARLLDLVAYIEETLGHAVNQRVYTDTGPILEGEFAQRAGLGWLGKNTLLISPKIGSWVLLSEILLDVALPIDDPITTDHCGSCTRCIEACPTEAILEDERLIDANKCISYQTIEQKAAIPVDLRSQFEDWIFGCDICQEVCPWNTRFAIPTLDPAFLPRPHLPTPELVTLLEMEQADFSKAFKGSPIKRTKRRGMARNAAVALGNMQAANGFAALQTALQQHDEPLVRGHAAWALAQYTAEIETVKQVLQAALALETNEMVLLEIKNAYASLLA